MKQVWLLNHYATDPSNAGGTRHFHLAQNLKNLGWHTSIIASSFDHVSGKQRLAPKERYRWESLQGVDFLWVNTPNYRGNAGGRVRNMLAYTFAVLLRKTTYELPHPDVVIGSSVHPFAALAGALLARRFKVPFIFEVRDLWPQTLIDMGRLHENSILTWVLRKLEIWLYRRAACTIVLMPLAWKYIVPLGIAKERIVWIPNGVELDLFQCSNSAESIKESIFTLMYFGAHGQANGLDNLLQAMAHLQEMGYGQRILLRLIGDGPLKLKLMALAEALSLFNVKFEPSVSKREMPALAAQADAFVITIPDLARLYQFGVSPNKLYDYFAAGRPILIAADIPENPVIEANAGFVVPPSQPRALAEAIVKMIRTPVDERQQMGISAREFVERNHSFEILAERFADILDTAVS